MDSSSGAHGETALLCCQGNAAAPESQGDQFGAAEARTPRGGVWRVTQPCRKFFLEISGLPGDCCDFLPQMQGLCSSDDAMTLLDHLETQYYELQLQLYEIQAEILQCEELLLSAQLDSIHRQMTGHLLFCHFDKPYL